MNKGNEETVQLMTRKEAARYLKLQPHTLAVWHSEKRYDLKPIKIGRAVRYLKSELDRFLKERST